MHSAGKQAVMVCFGTRPEVIKLAPVIAALDAHPRLRALPVTTGQHRQMLEQMTSHFGIEPAVDLALMKPRQELAELTAEAVTGVGRVLAEERPSTVLVQGDTTTAFCAALAAYYAGVPVGHVEAGLRTDDLFDPFPEEGNRRLISTLARWHFCPTERNARALLREGVDPQSILITGNTVIEALRATADRAETADLPQRRAGRRILVTLHRRETQGEDQRRLCRALANIADRHDVDILFPVHLSPAVRDTVEGELAGHDRVILTEPLEYGTFVRAMRSADLIVTDSGGVQEEAPTFGVPVLVLRQRTERQEAIDAGCAVLVGTEPDALEHHADRLLSDPDAYDAMARVANPFGDGHAAERIVAALAGEPVTPMDPAVGTAS